LGEGGREQPAVEFSSLPFGWLATLCYFGGNTGTEANKASGRAVSRFPLFTIKAVVSVQEIALNPVRVITLLLVKVVVRDILSKVVDDGGGEFRVVEGDDVVAGTMVTQELDVAVPHD